MNLKDKLAAAMNRASQSPMDNGGRKKKARSYPIDKNEKKARPYTTDDYGNKIIAKQSPMNQGMKNKKIKG